MIKASKIPAAMFLAGGWRRWVLWAGMLAFAIGFAYHQMWREWPSGRYAELLLLVAASLALAWLPGRLMPERIESSIATRLATVWLAALALYAGIVPTLATLLFAVAAIALGTLLVRRDSPALQCAVGFAAVAGLVGWLLPFPVHSRWAYLAACLLLVALRRNALFETWRTMRSAWTAATTAAPTHALMAVLILGLASTGSWLPTLQYDDLGYHLRLPWMLMETGRYPLDPTFHIWALAPWASDVLHAIPQVLAGEEARGPVNAAWLVLAASGIWQLAALLGGDARAQWLAVALYASLPLTATLAAGMQTETATAALLPWLAVLTLRRHPADGRDLFAGAILVGGLVALKFAAAVFAVLVTLWALVRNPPRSPAWRYPLAILVAIVLGGSSYAYAGAIAGNPFLPLFNGVFESPYFRSVNFDDPRWGAGFDPRLLWALTFQSESHVEGFDGAAGFVLVALSGAWLLCLLDRRLLAVGVLASALVWVPLSATHYLRYLHPALTVLLPLLVVSTFRADGKRAPALLAALCVLNLAFQTSGHWMLRSGAVKETIVAFGEDAPLFGHYAPERLLAESIRAHGRSTDLVLLIDVNEPFIAELGGRGRNIAWYSPSLESAASQAESVAGGTGWVELFRRERIRHVIISDDEMTPVREAALAQMGAVQRERIGDASWWELPMGPDAR